MSECSAIATFLAGRKLSRMGMDSDRSSISTVAERTSVSVSSISKSHAAPGFRSGWAVGSAEFAARLLPLSETMLFGNQPFIADMTAAALRAPSTAAAGMRQRFALRAGVLADRLGQGALLSVHWPEARMFALIDISATGLTDHAYAFDLLDRTGVAVMPGASFGHSLSGWVRVALTVPDAVFAEACDRIAAHSLTLSERRIA